ncbi:MAG: nucleoside deaminase [Rhodospirillales bacterium]|nr:MAG: nucleoside deaminase [Rhodospirillales bacterium]
MASRTPATAPDSPRAHRRRRLLSTLAAAAVVGVGAGATPARTARRTTEDIDQPASPGDAAFIRRAFEMRRRAIEQGDQAFGAVIVRGDRIIAQSSSRVILDQDPTGHAEMAAIRDAARRLGDRNLRGAIMYSSSRPCPMCEAAAYWAGIETMIFGQDATDAGAPRLCR